MQEVSLQSLLSCNLCSTSNFLFRYLHVQVLTSDFQISYCSRKVSPLPARPQQPLWLQVEAMSGILSVMKLVGLFLDECVYSTGTVFHCQHFQSHDGNFLFSKVYTRIGYCVCGDGGGGGGGGGCNTLSLLVCGSEVRVVTLKHQIKSYRLRGVPCMQNILRLLPSLGTRLA